MGGEWLVAHMHSAPQARSHYSPLTAHGSRLTAHHSPFTARVLDLRLTAHNAPGASLRWPSMPRVVRPRAATRSS